MGSSPKSFHSSTIPGGSAPLSSFPFHALAVDSDSRPDKAQLGQERPVPSVGDSGSSALPVRRAFSQLSARAGEEGAPPYTRPSSASRGSAQLRLAAGNQLCHWSPPEGAGPRLRVRPPEAEPGRGETSGTKARGAGVPSSNGRERPTQRPGGARDVGLVRAAPLGPPLAFPAAAVGGAGRPGVLSHSPRGAQDLALHLQ